MKRYTYLIILFAIIFSACEEAFETVLEIDPPKHEPQLVVNLFINQEETFFEARVGKTIAILDRLDLEEDKVNDAVVGLYKEGVLLKSLENHMDRGLNNFTLELDEPIVYGSGTYELKVEHPDFPNVISEQIMPIAPSNIEVKLIEDGGLDIDGEAVARLELEFDDDGNVDNYYEITTMFVDSVGFRFYPIPTYTTVPGISPSVGDDSHLLTDVGFNGKRHVIKFVMPEYYYDDAVQFGNVLISSITKDQYQYLRSVSRSQGEDNVGGFTEPALIYSNIVGGQGCFGMSNSQLIKI